MNKKPISTLILEVLKKNRKWFWGGQLEDAVHRISPHKASTVSRTARALVEGGLIENTYRKVVGVKNRCVMYRMKTKNK